MACIVPVPIADSSKVARTATTTGPASLAEAKHHIGAFPQEMDLDGQLIRRRGDHYLVIGLVACRHQVRGACDPLVATILSEQD
jgi:hypothetical protein